MNDLARVKPVLAGGPGSESPAIYTLKLLDLTFTNQHDHRMNLWVHHNAPHKWAEDQSQIFAIPAIST